MAGLPERDQRSPNTVKGYAHDLKDWFGFLAGHGLDWRRCSWTTLVTSWPGCGCRPKVRTGEVLALPSVAEHCGDSTVYAQAVGPQRLL